MTAKERNAKVASAGDIYIAKATEYDKASRNIKKMITVFKSKKFEDLCLLIFDDKKNVNYKKLESKLLELGLLDDKKQVYFYVKTRGEWKAKHRKYDACTWCMKDFIFLMFLVGAKMVAPKINLLAPHTSLLDAALNAAIAA